ncbi:histidine phosphatase family protein [Streptomyces sp. NPDC059802]|uniref:histidine phosphatase family protein n=1 Tax=Streptomyces sp. NPDC059802 TaxID=3346952 RepID=UPI00365A8530
MRTLYVVTHPEATHHVEGVVGGWHDSQLTPAGVRAARSIAQALRAQVPDCAGVVLFAGPALRPAAGRRGADETRRGVEGAETKAACAQRIYAAVDEILRSPCEHQVIVTHGGSLTFVVASWIRMPIESAGYASFRAPSGSITTLREDDFFHNRQVVSLGDTRHLDFTEAG